MASETTFTPRQLIIAGDFRKNIERARAAPRDARRSGPAVVHPRGAARPAPAELDAAHGFDGIRNSFWTGRIEIDRLVPGNRMESCQVTAGYGLANRDSFEHT